MSTKTRTVKGGAFADEARGSTLRRSSGQALLTRALRGVIQEMDF